MMNPPTIPDETENRIDDADKAAMIESIRNTLAQWGYGQPHHPPLPLDWARAARRVAARTIGCFRHDYTVAEWAWIGHQVVELAGPSGIGPRANPRCDDEDDV